MYIAYYFINSLSSMEKKKIFVLLDPCHMLKLIRNLLFGKLQVIVDGDGNIIKWSFLEKFFFFWYNFKNNTFACCN
ncbi:hypothetical protein ALC56_08113 [Trachymyrmex septentrionalis]|uniref:Transposable element P transposase-like GTP-binding insertion domain-containing protein n=1 Tax=Trachymyrmex septentrionalis TaxID=34720 RepID=A0A195FBB1_9HYME|nr:hypothetical protein ALC56_08113 [Trachymyrmex septentrionalis]